MMITETQIDDLPEQIDAMIDSSSLSKLIFSMTVSGDIKFDSYITYAQERLEMIESLEIS